MPHTTSLALSKELYEKGLKIETEKWWVKIDKRIIADDGYTQIGIEEGEWFLNIGLPYGLRDGAIPNGEIFHVIPAYSTDELLTVMPYKIIVPDKYEYNLFIIKRENNYGIKYLNEQGQGILLQLNGSYAYSCETFLPEALGRMCLWLFQNGYHFNGKELGR